MSTATLHSEKKKALVPELRFQEFDDKWMVKKFSALLKEGRLGGNYENSESNNGIPVIKMGNLGRGEIIINKVQFLPEDIEYKKEDILKKGDLLFNTRNTLELVGKVSIWREELPFALYNSNLMRMKFNNEIEPSNVFMNYNFNTKNSINQLRCFATGTTSVAAIYGKDLKGFNVTFPTLSEQKKIASFLSAVDEKIQQLSRKKELLEQYKKGVMQQLFSGKLRFKDENGEDYADWEEKTFGDIYSFYTTNSLSREKLNYDSGAVKNIHYGDIHTKFKTLFDINKEVVPFVNSDFDISKIKSECYCQEGDLVIADASEDYADIGKSIEIINLQNEKIVAGLHTFLARPNKTKMYIGFSGYIVRSDSFRKQIMTIAQGSKVLSISTGRIAMLKMKIPKVEEQQKIANFLSNIDTKIESTSQQINQTQSFKKGLLQQMFV